MSKAPTQSSSFECRIFAQLPHYAATRASNYDFLPCQNAHNLATNDGCNGIFSDKHKQTKKTTTKKSKLKTRGKS